MLFISKDLGKRMVWDVGNGPGNCLLAMDSYISLQHPTFYHRESWRGDGGQAEKQLNLRNQGPEEVGLERESWSRSSVCIEKGEESRSMDS